MIIYSTDANNFVKSPPRNPALFKLSLAGYAGAIIQQPSDVIFVLDAAIRASN